MLWKPIETQIRVSPARLCGRRGKRTGNAHTLVAVRLPDGHEGAFATPGGYVGVGAAIGRDGPSTVTGRGCGTSGGTNPPRLPNARRRYQVCQICVNTTISRVMKPSSIGARSTGARNAMPSRIEPVMMFSTPHTIVETRQGLRK